MIILLEALLFFAILYYFYSIAFKNTVNPLGISKPVAIAILIVGFLILPVPIKGLILIIAILALLIKFAKVDKNHLERVKDMWR